MSKKNTKVELLPHSEAKIQLFEDYFRIYLNILSRVRHVSKIFLFDLMCGEGKYKDGKVGSPLIALRAIRDHYFANNESIPDLEIWFNDNGQSLIETGVAKVDRVKRFSQGQFIPENVELRFFQEDYNNIYLRALETVTTTVGAKGLFFIDPYGYKDISIDHLRQVLACGDTEVLLFLPTSHMYRFAEAALRNEFPGSQPLETFLGELLETGDAPQFRSTYHFTNWLEGRFRAALADLAVYVTPFTIERDASNLYCLFFFTSSITGLAKMLESKWKLDKQRGRGYNAASRDKPLFSEIQIAHFPEKLADFLSGEERRTNDEVWRFTLEQGFLPKHTNEIFRRFAAEERLQVISLDGKRARKNAFYVGNSSRRVQYVFTSSE